ncbi:hypothetical protein Bca101_099605 [Brassica carinata]|uniref:Uncharacterized protein n=1 Tax=Brassica oleracea var. oleracea TaxID=109376 RepID=A0A0D3CYT2_BRAOL
MCLYSMFYLPRKQFFFLTQSLMISLFNKQCQYIKPRSLTCKVSVRRTQPQVISFSKYENSEIYLQNEIFKEFSVRYISGTNKNRNEKEED